MSDEMNQAVRDAAKRMDTALEDGAGDTLTLPGRIVAISYVLARVAADYGLDNEALARLGPQLAFNALGAVDVFRAALAAELDALPGSATQ